MEFPFFHGNITRRACEELLSKNGKNGSYLVRESESMEGALCLCVLAKQISFVTARRQLLKIYEKLIYTYRIFREHQGYFRIQWFRLSMKDTVSHYEEWFVVKKKDYILDYSHPTGVCCHAYQQTCEGVPDKIFRTLKDLIYTYEKPNQGLVTSLRYPVNKSKTSRRNQKLKSGEDSIYDEVGESDYICVLP